MPVALVVLSVVYLIAAMGFSTFCLFLTERKKNIKKRLTSESFMLFMFLTLTAIGTSDIIFGRPTDILLALTCAALLWNFYDDFIWLLALSREDRKRFF
jgi:hypothetical protein